MRFAIDCWANPKKWKPAQSCEPRFLERLRRRALKELRGWRPYSLDYPELIRVPKNRGAGAQKGDLWVSRSGYTSLLVPAGRAATFYRSRGLMPGAVAGLVVCHQLRRAFWRSILSRGRIDRRRAPFSVVYLLLGANSASARIEDRLQQAAQFPDAWRPGVRDQGSDRFNRDQGSDRFNSLFRTPEPIQLDALPDPYFKCALYVEYERQGVRLMPTDYISGDLFDNTHHVQAFAHGCNCQGSMGAGVAKTFRARYPEIYDEYRRRCKAEPRQFNLGECWLWKADKQPWVFNLGTQERYWRARASYEAIGTALRSMRKQADAEDITSIAMPCIGVGYGGLSWKKVRDIVEAAVRRLGRHAGGLRRVRGR